MVHALLILGFRASPWMRTLADGTKLELLAITDERRKQSWMPDGRPLGKWITDYSTRIHSKDANWKPAEGFVVVLRVRTPLPNEEPSVRVFAEGTELGGRSTSGEVERLFVSPYRVSAKGPLQGPTTTLTVRAAGGKWRTVGAVDLKSFNAVGVKFDPVVVDKYWARNRYRSLEATATPPASFYSDRHAERLMLYDTAGRQLEGIGYADRMKPTDPLDFGFLPSKLPVRRVELQTRNYETVRFENVKVPAGAPAG